MTTTIHAPSPATAAQEWRAHGFLVFSAFLGVSLTALPTSALGLFMEPLSRDFGWTRTEISFGLSIMALMGLPLAPVSGLLVDRFGSRRVAIPGLVLSGLLIASFSMLTGVYWQWLATWVLLSLASMGTRILVWSTAISTAFTVGRGLAIAVLLCGTALATSAAPTAAHTLIEAWGWRAGFIGLGLGWGGIALVMTILFFHDPGSTALPRDKAAGAAASTRLGGLTVGEAIRTVRLYRIAGAICISTGMGSAVIVHLIPMLTADGLSRAEAAGMAALVGTGSIVGKLATGWLMDRFTTSFIPLIFFGGPSIAYTLILKSSGSPLTLSLAIFLMGICSGASLHLGTYLTTRYAGMRSFGTIFGLISSLMALSSAVGPLVAGAIFDSTGSYNLLLTTGIPLALLGGGLVFGLGAYPTFAGPEKEVPPAASI